MALKITRRDFLNGMAIGAGAGLLMPGQVIGQTTASLASSKLPGDYYPPTLTGMRGSHEGSYEVAHALAWNGQKPSSYEELDEHYDLVVVGAGQSGLAAAWYYRKKMGPAARILLLDNHDDFGGHAKRNEFHQDGNMVLGLGGAQNIEPMSSYSAMAIELLKDIGIDDQALAAMTANTPDDYMLGGKFGASNGMTIPAAGGHKNLSGNWLEFFHGGQGYGAAVKELPIPEEEQAKLIAFFGGDRDFLDDLSLLEQYRYVKSVSYNQFLTERVGLAEETLPILGAFTRVLLGPAGWNLTVLEALSVGCPGLKAMGWLTNRLSDLAGAFVLGDAPVAYIFPDGNASVARLLVHKLIPNVAPAMKGFEDVAISNFNYEALDLDDNSTRLRLNSTVVGVKETALNHVRVDYVEKGQPFSISADHCILACYNGLIPHLCPEMSDQQKEGLSYGVKVPFVYANVLLKNGRAFAGLDTTFTQCPYDPFQWVSAAPTVTSGGYQPPQSPDRPMAAFMMASPTPADIKGMPARELFRLGRHKIYGTPFKDYEQQIRDQLQGMLGQYGFNHETDITAITVNRIPHGYAYSYLGLDDPDWDEGHAPHEIGRAQFGRISIANSDSEAMPLMQAAFDAAWRAVQEQSA
ncbi:MAG: NAD(P)/FAD-dependent oxidoreductase [Porticoccaceae bacterium]|nr:NAD(P)/FAD-dependent oxidoreductase [Porticoccaceae bacterium]MDA7853492.1 NAD(P)/FAD-dependent oxidoreductase [Porticoccaceae bacterium]MDB2479825.1 NAD(P)/FAD-dependent oxidoreductase [Porticoccaceae bacterium]MDG1705553.1 NAD(P)/FAD-dependent oxidoreductase [Porticoccaceae bacterium]